MGEAVGVMLGSVGGRKGHRGERGQWLQWCPFKAGRGGGMGRGGSVNYMEGRMGGRKRSAVGRHRPGVGGHARRADGGMLALCGRHEIAEEVSLSCGPDHSDGI
jgi:hypothetical protein